MSASKFSKGNIIENEEELSAPNAPSSMETAHSNELSSSHFGSTSPLRPTRIEEPPSPISSSIKRNCPWDIEDEEEFLSRSNLPVNTPPIISNFPKTNQVETNFRVTNSIPVAAEPRKSQDGLDAVGRHYMELPKFLAKKEAIINVKADDEKCFAYAISAYKLFTEFENKDSKTKVTPAKVANKTEGTSHGKGRPRSNNPKRWCSNLNRPSTFSKHFERFGLDNISYPVDPKNISEIEDQLQLRINLISFFDDEGRERYPFYISKKTYPEEVDLLYWNGHFAWIKNFSRFMSDLTKGKRKLYFCKNCFCHSQTQKALDNHQLNCTRPEFPTQISAMPEPGTRLSFKNMQNENECPVVIGGKLESARRTSLVSYFTLSI